MKESMIIYESAYKAINYLPDDKLKLEAYQGLMEYGFYGVIPESDNPFVNMIFVQAIPSMRSASERYEKAVQNGKKGGRPTDVSTEEIMEMKQGGMTNKQIAEKLGCSEKNIEKRVSTYNRTHPTNPTNPPTNPTLNDGGVYPTNPTNLSVSYTVSYTDTVSDTDTESSSSEAEDNICPEEKDDIVVEAEISPEEKEPAYTSGHDRRIRDLSEDEAKAIKEKLRAGVRYLDIEREYHMKRGSITGDFEKHWKMFLFAKANGRI